MLSAVRILTLLVNSIKYQLKKRNHLFIMNVSLPADSQHFGLSHFEFPDKCLRIVFLRPSPDAVRG